jgi:hypothetical protein
MEDDHDDRRRGGGPEGTEFLDLEITRVLYGEAEKLARESVRDILRGALQARLRERLGARLEALARVAADALADEVETNLRIEELVRAQAAKKKDVEERVRAAMASDEPSAGPREPRAPRGKPRRG